MVSDKYFLTDKKPELNQEKLDGIVRRALIEDIGKGDITTQLTIPENKKVKANLTVKEKEGCVVCGLKVAERVFKTVDGSVKFKKLSKEGEELAAGAIIA